MKARIYYRIFWRIYYFAELNTITQQIDYGLAYRTKNHKDDYL